MATPSVRSVTTRPATLVTTGLGSGAPRSASQPLGAGASAVAADDGAAGSNMKFNSMVPPGPSITASTCWTPMPGCEARTA